MNLNCETVLNAYTYKNRKILCQIKVNANSGKFKNSCRCLSQEQWVAFDKELEKLITTIDDWNNEKCLKFNIKPFILVKIQKSNLSLKHFVQCLKTTSDFLQNDGGEVEETNFILECLFDFQREISFSPSFDSRETTLDSIPCSPLSYDPYTPTMKKYNTDVIDTVKTPGIDFLRYDESSCSQKAILADVDNDSLSTEIIKKSELKSTNATSYPSKTNRDENLNITLTDHKHKTQSRLNATPSSRDGNKSRQSDLDKNKDSVNSPSEDQHLKIKTKWVKNFKADNSGKHKERSKSEDIILEQNDKDEKEKHRYKKKNHRTDKDNGHYDIKTARSRSRTIDEFPKELFSGAEKTLPKNILENVIKQPHKRNDTPYKFSSQLKEEKKRATSSKENSSSEKRHRRSFDEYEPTSTCTAKTKKTSKSPLLKNDKNLSESEIELSPQKLARKERKLKPCSKETIISVRRSERSPSKPKRFTEEQPEISVKPKKHKSNKKRELFGTDDDDDNIFEAKKEININNDKKNNSTILKTPVCKKPVQSTSSTSSSSSKKKKRKRDSSAECQQEKRGMSKWLSKKNLKPLDHQEKTSSKNTSKPSHSKPLPLKALTNVKSRKIERETKPRSKSITPPPMTIELPSKEELELMRNKTNLMREENAKLKAELDKMRISPPKEVEILSLENIPVDDILSTLSKYKAELDEVYHTNRKKDHIKGHDGINHCLIIRLLQQSVQMKMLEKLTDVYGGSNTTTQATLFANALLPEWVIRVYMEKFHFTRQQAIDQIKAQEAFQLHMEEQDENSFEFDLNF